MGRKNWEALWEDIRYLLDNTSETEEHFVGAFVCMPSDMVAGQVPNYLVIDGQQRLVTFALLLCAIRDQASQSDSDEIAELGDEIHERYLFDKYKDDIERYCVVSRAEDRQTLFTLLSREDLAEEDETMIGEAYQYFKKRIAGLVEEENEDALQTLRNTIMQQMPLALVTASEEENPYAIFETLNERGVPLEESDLIRNHVFMHLDIDEQEEFNEDYWMPFEDKFSETNNHEKLDLTRFYRTYLMRNGDYVKKNSVYEAFRKRIDVRPVELAEELEEQSTRYFWIKRPSTAPENWLSDRITRYNLLNIGTADSLLLGMLEEYQNESINSVELKRLFDGLESFAIRRSFCDESTRGYYRMFPNAAKRFDETGDIDEIFSYLSERGWPNDRQFKESFEPFKIYDRDKDKAYLLLKIFEENHNHKEPVDFENLTIEHVLPQTIDSEDEHGHAWIDALGSDWEQKHEDLLHTIGNLTLTGYNSDLSNKKYEVKKEKGLKNSHLEINNRFEHINQWDDAEIRDRGLELADQAARIWPVPTAAVPSTGE